MNTTNTRAVTPNREQRRHPELVTLKQLLELRSWLSERYIRRLVSENRIGYYKPAGTLLFDLDEIDDYVAGGRVEPAK
jgi:excisionase family DNA binding protein